MIDAGASRATVTTREPLADIRRKGTPAVNEQPSSCPVWELVNRVRGRLAGEFAPDGYNLGVNVGPAAGQILGHAHVHVIPRRLGDRDDPRGGIRWIFSERAQYWPEGRPADQQDMCPTQRVRVT